jgi:hypothetical protein
MKSGDRGFKSIQVVFAELGQRSAEPATYTRFCSLKLSYHLKLKLEVLNIDLQKPVATNDVRSDTRA